MSYFAIYAVFASLVWTDFVTAAARNRVNPIILEGICRYESDSGRDKLHHNRNGSWDVGYCQINRLKKTKKPPRIPSDKFSLREGAKALAYWKKQHEHFCVYKLKKTGKCGGMKNCRRNHAWFGHYNWGFRVLKNSYDKKVQCFIDNGLKKCKKTQWRRIRF